MQKQTGDTYQSSKYMKAMGVSEAKVGKSTFLIASILGLMPRQKYGALVTSPQHLHVVTFDANALGGIKKFLMQTLGASEEALKFNVYNLQDDLRRVSTSTDEYDVTMFNSVMQAVHEIEASAKSGTHAVLISSLTGLAQALERAIAGPPQKKGGGMDQSKWSTFAHQMNEVRNWFQLDKWHSFWEAHVYRPPATGQGGEVAKETLQISGKTGQNFAYNVEQVLRIRRMFGVKEPGNSKVDTVLFDTQPTLDFIAGGRNFTEVLDAKEYDLTLMADKLGTDVGGWRPKKAKK